MPKRTLSPDSTVNQDVEMLRSSTISLTFGEVAENHVRMQQLGEMADAGLTKEELVGAKKALEEEFEGAQCELIDLNRGLEGTGIEGEEAAVLVVRNGVNLLLQPHMGADDLYEEQAQLDVDKKALMRGRVVNKRARYNLCFATDPQDPDIESGKGRVISFSSQDCMAALRSKLPTYFGPKAENLYAEGNYYFDPSCGIGYHGDAERRIVIAARLGKVAPIPLQYHWFQNSKPVGNPIRLSLSHGDMYAMSSKAVGTDWMKKKIPTLRHAAGAEKFLALTRFAR